MNPVGHKVTCRCSEECSEHSRQYQREWKARNADKVREYKAKERAKYVPRPPRPKPTEAELAERHRASLARDRRRRAQNPEPLRRKEREARRVRYQSDPEARLRILEQNRTWKQANPSQVIAVRERWTAQNADYLQQMRRSYRVDRKRVISPRAINHGQHWSPAEIRVAFDPTLTEAEAALLLGRTIDAVTNKRYKVRRAAA